MSKYIVKKYNGSWPWDYQISFPFKWMARLYCGHGKRMMFGTASDWKRKGA